MKFYDNAQEAYVAHKATISKLLGISEAGYSSLSIAQQIAVNNKLLILSKEFYEAVGCPKFLLFNFAILHDANLFAAAKSNQELSQALDKYIGQQIKYMSGYCALQTTHNDGFLQWAQTAGIQDGCPITKIMCTSFLEGCYDNELLERELNSALILQDAVAAKDVFTHSIGITNGLRLAMLHDTGDDDIPMHALLHAVGEDIISKIPEHENFLQQVSTSEVAEVFQSSVARELSRQSNSKLWEDAQKSEIEKLIKHAKKAALLQQHVASNEQIITKMATEQDGLVTNYNANINEANNLAQKQNAAAQRSNVATQKFLQHEREAKLATLEALDCQANINVMGGSMMPAHRVGVSLGFNSHAGFAVTTNHSILQRGQVVASASSVYKPAIAYQQRVNNVVAQSQLHKTQQGEQASLKIKESLTRLQNVIGNNPKLQVYRPSQAQLVNPYADKSKVLFNDFKPGANAVNNYGQGAIEATLLLNRAATLANLKNENVNFKPEFAGSFLHKTGQSLQPDNNKQGFKKLVNTTIDAAVTILTGSGKAEASPLIFSAPLNSAAATAPLGAGLNNSKQGGKDNDAKFKPLVQELREINDKAAQFVSFTMSIPPAIVYGLLTTPPHLRNKDDYVLPGKVNTIDAKDIKIPPTTKHEINKDDLDTGHTSAAPNLPNANVNVPQENSSFLFMFKETLANGEVKFKRWKPGDAIDKPLPEGTMPENFNTIKARYWKNRYLEAKGTNEFGRENLIRMKEGLAPLDYNPRTKKYESRELHHVIAQKYGGESNPLNLRELTPDQHAEVDPYRQVPGVKTKRGIR